MSHLLPSAEGENVAVQFLHSALGGGGGLWVAAVVGLFGPVGAAGFLGAASVAGFFGAAGLAGFFGAAGSAGFSGAAGVAAGATAWVGLSGAAEEAGLFFAASGGRGGGTAGAMATPLPLPGGPLGPGCPSILFAKSHLAPSDSNSLHSIMASVSLFHIPKRRLSSRPISNGSEKRSELGFVYQVNQKVNHQQRVEIESLINSVYCIAVSVLLLGKTEEKRRTDGGKSSSLNT